MTKKAIIKKLDDALRPIGFVRRKATWNRWSDSLVEVIDIQFAKDDDGATMNVGVLDPAVYVKVWRREPPLFVQEPECTIRARVGELIDGKDRWWELRTRAEITCSTI